MSNTFWVRLWEVIIHTYINSKSWKMSEQSYSPMVNLHWVRAWFFYARTPLHFLHFKVLLLLINQQNFIEFNEKVMCTVGGYFKVSALYRQQNYEKRIIQNFIPNERSSKEKTSSRTRTSQWIEIASELTSFPERSQFSALIYLFKIFVIPFILEVCSWSLLGTKFNYCF